MADGGVWGPGLVTVTPKTLKASELLQRSGILEIVAVHGLRGERDKAWGSGATWLEKHITTYVANARVSTFSYELNEEGIDGGDIERVAKALLDGICNGELADASYTRTFVFIGHNTGGLIIKQALLMANDDPIYSVVARDTSLLLFFGTPQRAKSRAGWEKIAHNLIYATGQKNQAPLSDILLQSSFTLRDVNERYARLAKIYDAISYYETVKLDDFVGLVLDQYSSTMGLPNETVLPRDTNHLDFCRNIKDTDKIFTNMCDRMSTALAFDPQYIDCLHTLSLVSEMTQISPSTLSKSLEPKWILEDKTYLEFVSQKSDVLQILGQSGSGLSAISAFLPPNLARVEKLPAILTSPTVAQLERRSEEPTILTFSFDSRDYRTCCTSTLFASLLRQLLGGDPGYFKYIRHMYIRVANSDWNLETLWTLFRSTISSPNIGRVYCVIDAINKCDPERNHFLGDFLSLAKSTNSRFKVIFTNSSGNADTYQYTSLIDVDKQDSKQKDLESLIDLNITELIAWKPEFGELSTGFDGFSKTIREKVLSLNPNFLIITLIFGWLQDNQVRSTRSEIQQLLDDMPKTLPEIYEQAYLKNCSSAPEWQFKALSWITHAFRPLKIEELATALAIESGDEGFRISECDRPRNLGQDLKRAFGSFLNLQGDEISLVHESAREFLLQTSKDWDPKAKGRQFFGHARISSICLDYLLTAEWDELAAEAGNSNLESLPSPDGVSSLFSYAAKYWYIHYRVAEKNDQLFKKVRQFLANDERRTLWGHVEWLEGNKLASRRDTSNLRHVAAQLGLNEVLLSLLDDDPIDDTYVASIAAARGDLELLKKLPKRGPDSSNLEFAARNGYLSVVSYLLQVEIPEAEIQDYLGPALHAAAQNGYVDVFMELLRNKADASSLVNDMTPLHLAAEFGNVEICQKLVEDDVDVNARNESSSTALHLATLAGQLASMELLLNSEAEIDASDDQSLRPLHHAASSGLADAVKLLISRQAPVDSTSWDGRTPLHLAAQEGNSRSIQELLIGDAEVNIVADDIGSPLNVVAITGNLEIAKLIIDAGADLSIVDGQNCTALHLAAKYGRTSLVQMLLEHELDIDGVGGDGRTALHFAAWNGSFGIVKALLAKDAAVNVIDEFEYTPLATAAKLGDLRTVQALIEARAEVLPMDNSLSALHEAAAAGHVEVMSALLGAGASPDGEVGGDTPLHAAVKSGKVQAVQIILEANIDVDARDTDEDTPLLDAALLGHSDIVKLLLKQGASPQLINAFSANFLHRAIISGSLDVVKLALKEKDLLLGSDSNSFIPLHEAAQRGFTEAVSKLLASGSRTKQIEARTSRERTALHLAAKSGHLEAVKLLLGAKSGINLVDSKLLTPLGLATKKQHFEVAQFLIEEGADANLADNRGLTPLFWAFDRGNKDLVALIQPKTLDLHQVSKRQNTYLNIAAREGMLDNVNELIKLGLNIDAKNVDSRTAIMLASEAQHEDCVKALIAAGADLSVVDVDAKTILYHPIYYGNKEAVDALLEGGALPECEGSDWPAVYAAAYWRQLDMVKDFIERKFDIEKPGSDGWTPLHGCYDSPDITSALLAAGAKTDTLNAAGISPVEFAIQTGYTDTVAIYLATGIDPLKGKSNDGRTPLHHAAQNGILGSVNLLIEQATEAVSFDVKDNKGLTPLQDAVTAGSVDVTEALLATSKCDIGQKNTDGKGLVAIAADVENIEMIELLVGKGAEVQPALADQLLKMAAVNGSSSLATMILENFPKHVDLSKEDEHGWTSEMFARALGNSEVVDVIRGSKGYDNRFTPDMLSPSEWSEAMKAPLLELDGSRLVVKDATGEDDIVDVMIVQGNHPIPILDKDFYFEIEVLDKGARNEIGIGLATHDTPLNRMPGWEITSWGYHGDNGQKYHDNYWGLIYDDAESYTTGDIVGCLYDVEKKEVSFTKNGEHLGVAFEEVTGRLFPVVGLGQGTRIKANFGRTPYKYREYKEKENLERRRTTGITRRRTHKDFSESAPRTPI